MTPVVIVDEIAEVVEKTSAALLEKEGWTSTVYYMHGHPKEIVARLQAMSNTASQQDNKFPVICLFQDFQEKRGGKIGMYADTSLSMIIATSTQRQFEAEERYNETFKPVLYPIYEEFMKQLANHRQFSTVGEEVPHTKIDRLFWGRETVAANSTDYIDCIELTNVQLIIKEKKC